MDRYSQFGLRGDADETLRRAFRDAFGRAGLGQAQLTQALEWYRDHGQRLGADPIKLAESFQEFATRRGWDPGHVAAATSVYDAIAEKGPAAVLAPTPSAEEDAATIAKASDLLRTDAKAYWKDEGLQEAQFEALERQQATAPAAPAVDDTAIERRIAERDVDKFARMLRDPASAAKYWASRDLQRQHHDAIEASLQAEQRATAPPPAAQPVAPVAAAAVPVASPPAAAAPAVAAEPPPSSEAAQ
jgi:hypothetical protein